MYPTAAAIPAGELFAGRLRKGDPLKQKGAPGKRRGWRRSHLYTASGSVPRPDFNPSSVSKGRNSEKGLEGSCAMRTIRGTSKS